MDPARTQPPTASFTPLERDHVRCHYGQLLKCFNNYLSKGELDEALPLAMNLLNGDLRGEIVCGQLLLRVGRAEEIFNFFNKQHSIQPSLATCFMLGAMYERGFHVPSNFYEAIIYFNEAANFGDINALMSLVNIYRDQLGGGEEYQIRADEYQEKYLQVAV